jgi:sulfopropanediol 3-dehydrogenase
VTEYLKQAPMHDQADQDQVRDAVSRMLLDIERNGMRAIRKYSAALDAWTPSSFLVGPDEIARAAGAVDPELRVHISFAQEQVRRFAERQRATLVDLEVETLPGVTLGHRHIPVESVGCYAPGGRYPMIASVLMTVLVAKVAGVETVIACAPPQAGLGIEPAMLHAMATSGADRILCLGGVLALAAMAFGIEDL